MDTLSTALENAINNSEINKLLDEIELPEGINEEDLKTFIGVLSLPDSMFDLIAPMMLEQLENECSSIEYKQTTLMQLRKSGGTIEDLRTQSDSIIQVFDEIKELSQNKKDFLKAIFDITANALEEFTEKERITIPIQFLNENVQMPAYAHDTDSGMDIYALEDITIKPGETKLIPTGIKVAIPDGYELQVRPKSGRCLKTKLRIANTPGTIDAGYRDEIGVIVDNIDPPIKEVVITEDGKMTGLEYGSSYTIGKGEKFAQLVLQKVPQIIFRKVEDINLYSGDRGGGFGSSGLK